MTTHPTAPTAGDQSGAQHTAGPWKVDNFSSERFFPMVKIGGDRITINQNPPAADANARLIASAPELLAALEDCITYDGATAQRSLAFACQRLHAISEIARAAIAKAKGTK